MNNANISTITPDWVAENIRRHQKRAMEANMRRRAIAVSKQKNRETARQITSCELLEAVHAACIEDLQVMMQTVTL